MLLTCNRPPAVKQHDDDMMRTGRTISQRRVVKSGQADRKTGDGQTHKRVLVNAFRLIRWLIAVTTWPPRGEGAEEEENRKERKRRWEPQRCVDRQTCSWPGSYSVACCRLLAGQWTLNS